MHCVELGVTAAPRHSDAGTSALFEARDGLRLHAVLYGPRSGPALPVVCLPGLTRNAGDFRELAAALANDQRSPRLVVAVDYRGRGQSEYDSNPANYALPVELADLCTVLDKLGIGRAVFIGTSRGGLLTMLLATTQPERIAGVVLNDIGPVLEMAGLLRIKSYVGRLPQPRSLQEGAEILLGLFASQFPRLPRDSWLAAAQMTWVERGGRLTLNYDAALSQALAAVEPDKPPPPMWEYFDALPPVPLMVIRGGLSDLLSRETVEEMRRRRPEAEVVEAPDEGHPPLLSGSEMIGRICTFVRRCDEAR